MQYPNNIEFTITRYELTPKEVPSNIIVCICAKDLDTGKLSFFETTLDIKSMIGKTHAQVCQEAYSILRSKIDEFVIFTEQDKENIVGFKFIPNTNA